MAEIVASFLIPLSIGLHSILAGTLTPQSRGLSGLQPFVPSRAPYLNATLSTSTSIVIMWGRSEVMGISDATIFYEISYTLRKGATVEEGSMLVRV